MVMNGMHWNVNVLVTSEIHHLLIQCEVCSMGDQYHSKGTMFLMMEQNMLIIVLGWLVHIVAGRREEWKIVPPLGCLSGLSYTDYYNIHGSLSGAVVLLLTGLMM
jgi:hypothetical protein